MNLSPEWLPYLKQLGWQVKHWQEAGLGSAEDYEILAWAKTHQALVFTQELDFVQLLHTSGAAGPSVILLRAAAEQNHQLRHQVVAVIASVEQELLRGAILTINEKTARIRDLPLPVGSLPRGPV